MLWVNNKDLEFAEEMIYIKNEAHHAFLPKWANVLISKKNRVLPPLRFTKMSRF